MILSKENKPPINQLDETVSWRGDLPVRVLQFGTGVLLRGLPDYLIDKANKKGIFNGKIVVVKSTDQGNSDFFSAQDSLYTVLVKGVKNGQRVEESTICEAISEILSASAEWDRVLEAVENPLLKVVLSNTTEVGIQLVNEDISQQPPASFPAKLIAAMYHRFKFFNGSKDSGLVVIPTELLPDNGNVLKRIVLELADFNRLEKDFVDWINHNNFFCNSLVDRIVPGKLSPDEQLEFEVANGYTDNLLITAEPYLLWAIEGDEKIREILSFQEADEGIVVVPDITIYRELKLRLLNGTHTLLCGLAVLSGFKAVNTAMMDVAFQKYMDGAMKEISVAIPYKIDNDKKEAFINAVADRFRNPYIQHLWINICMDYTAKIKTRVVPTLVEYIRLYNRIPEHMAIGFAAYLIFMKSEHRDDGFYGNIRGERYLIKDGFAEFFHDVWKNHDFSDIAVIVFKNQYIWGSDLTLITDFAETVQRYMEKITHLHTAEELFNIGSIKALV